MLADNYLRCDSSGSCMMGDKLVTKDNFSMNVGVPGMGSFGIKTADNSLTCDSEGSCMLKDKLVTRRVVQTANGIIADDGSSRVIAYW